MNKDKQEFNVSPNPTHSVVSWNNFSNADEIAVINVNGKMVLRVANPTTNGIDLSSLQSGIYFLKIRENNSVITKKILKE